MQFPASSLVEALESRIAPAGIVTVSFENGALVLSGDQESSSLFFYNAGDGTYVLDVLDDTTVVRTDSDSNVFDGPIQSLNWIGGGGNDEIMLEGIVVDGDVTLDGGDGENRIYMGSIQTGGNFVVECNGFINRLDSDSSVLEVGGDFRINNNSDGYNIVKIYDSTVRVDGNIQIQGNIGNDVVYWEAYEFSVAQDIFVDCGDGENLAYFYLQTLDVGGDVTLLNGEHQGLTGGSLIDVPFGHVGGNLTMSEGDGDSGNLLSFEHLTIDGNLTISHPEGTASVGLGYYTEPGNTPTSKLFVGGNLQVTLAEYSNYLTSHLSTLQVGGKLSIEGGSGDDTVSFLGDDIVIAKGWSVNLHGGNNATDVIAETISIGRSLTIEGGAGTDTVSISGEALVTRNSIIADMGDGAGSISLTSSYVHVGGEVLLVSGDHTGEEFTETLGSERLSVKRGIEIHNGNGTNHAVIEAITSLNVSGGLIVTGGNDADSVTLNAYGSIKGGVRFTALDGDNRFILENDELLPRIVAVQGNFKINSTGSTEVVASGLTRVTGDVRIQLGTGSSSVRITTDAHININGSLVILGENTSADAVELRGLWVRGQTALRLGGGESQVSIDDSLFRSAFRLSTGAGNDSVAIEQYDSDLKLTFRSSTVINLGDGDDNLVIGGASEFDQVTFLAATTLNGGLGFDTVNDVEGQNILGSGATLTLKSF